jgi:shikimate dehydrogenase
MSEMFLVGHRIAHSLSPAMWNHLFSATGRDVHYGLRDVDEGELPAVEAELRSARVIAANVTMPHKSWAAALADHASDTVTSTGAANVLIPRDGRLEAMNTDVAGARSLLEVRAPYDRVIILGAGGTAVALAEALIGLASEVVIVNRTRQRSSDVVNRYQRRFGAMDIGEWDERDQITPTADLIVSTVPVLETSPIDVLGLRSDCLVYDAMYRSTPTRFQQELTQRGIALSDGLAHLAAQAIAMLEPLGFDAIDATLLSAGLTAATGRDVASWGRPLG